MLGINPHDGQAMYELQLELHRRAEGKRPAITADELLDLHVWLADVELDFKRLFPQEVLSPEPGPGRDAVGETGFEPATP